MAKSVLSAERFHNEQAAFDYVEAQLWPNGPVCPHCQNADVAKIGRLQGKTTRPGLRKCYACRKPFTVRIGSIFEDSHLPLRLWLQAIHLLCSSKKGISTRQLQRTLGCGMKTAWHLGHRIRLAMTPMPSIGSLGGQINVGDSFAGPFFHGVAICCANPQCHTVLSVIADPASVAADVARRVAQEIRGAKG